MTKTELADQNGYISGIRGDYNPYQYITKAQRHAYIKAFCIAQGDHVKIKKCIDEADRYFK